MTRRIGKLVCARARVPEFESYASDIFEKLKLRPGKIVWNDPHNT